MTDRHLEAPEQCAKPQEVPPSLMDQYQRLIADPNTKRENVPRKDPTDREYDLIGADGTKLNVAATVGADQKETVWSILDDKTRQLDFYKNGQRSETDFFSDQGNQFFDVYAQYDKTGSYVQIEKGMMLNKTDQTNMVYETHFTPEQKAEACMIRLGSKITTWPSQSGG